MNGKHQQSIYHANLIVNLIKWNKWKKWNNDQCWWECKKHHICEKDYIWNRSTWSCENSKYVGSTIDNSVTSCNEIKDEEAKLSNEETKTIPTNFDRKQPLKFEIYMFYVHFY